MTRSEYIIWKCETLDQIKELHPKWSSKQVQTYFNVVEAILRKQGAFGQTGNS